MLRGFCILRPDFTKSFFRGLPRRTVYAAICALTLVSIGTVTLLGMAAVRAFDDDSNASFWLAERARNAARAVWSKPGVAPTVEAAAARPAQARKAAQVHYAAAGSQSVCVRACDGYYFPVGRLNGSQDIAAHESVCQAQCPGARTNLYVLRKSGSMEDAVSARDGKPYARLAQAFLHTKTQENTCSCKPAGSVVQASVPVSRDIAIRRGDSVMTAQGVRIFRGKKGKTIANSDFVALSQSKDIDPQKRRILAELERVSAPRVAAARNAPANASVRAARSPAPASSPLVSAPMNKSVRLVGVESPLIR